MEKSKFANRHLFGTECRLACIPAYFAGPRRLGLFLTELYH